MSLTGHSPTMASNDEKTKEKTGMDPEILQHSNISLAEGEDILSLQDIDPALNAKMHIVNDVRTLPRSRNSLRNHI